MAFLGNNNGLRAACLMQGTDKKTTCTQPQSTQGLHSAARNPLSEEASR